MPRFSLGVAYGDITPPLGVQLCGYLPRPATAIDHPLRAEALVCEAGADGWALITADLLAVSPALVRAVRREIAAQTALRPEAVMVAATHTHSGPRAYAAGWNERPEEVEYLKQLRETLVRVAVEAWRTRRPGELVHGRTRAPELGSNRRVRKAAGDWGNEWSDPQGTHTGYFDPGVELLSVREPDGRLRALLVTYGCHPVGFGSQSGFISGDYPSYLKDELEAAGAAEIVLFGVSGHANIDPRVCVQSDPGPVREQGRALAQIVRQALPGLAPVAAGPVDAAREPWELELSWQLSEHSQGYFPVHRPGEIMTTEVQALRAGEILLLGLPGETVSEYQESIRRANPGAIPLLLSVANDFVGYLVTDAILEEGAYEAYMCPARPLEKALQSKIESVLCRLR